jgi:hypothetical protein
MGYRVSLNQVLGHLPAFALDSGPFADGIAAMLAHGKWNPSVHECIPEPGHMVNMKNADHVDIRRLNRFAPVGTSLAK